MSSCTTATSQPVLIRGWAPKMDGITATHLGQPNHAAPRAPRPPRHRRTVNARPPPADGSRQLVFRPDMTGIPAVNGADRPTPAVPDGAVRPLPPSSSRAQAGSAAPPPGRTATQRGRHGIDATNTLSAQLRK